MKSQQQDILEHLKEFGSISSMEAIELYGATRLSAIIYNLRKEGHDIIAENETVKNRYGRKVTFARYKLRGENSADSRVSEAD